MRYKVDIRLPSEREGNVQLRTHAASSLGNECLLDGGWNDP